MSSATPLHVYQLVPDAGVALLQGDLVYCSSTQHPNRVYVVTTYYAASNTLSGHLVGVGGEGSGEVEGEVM